MSLYKRLFNWLFRDDKEWYAISFNCELSMVSQQIRAAKLKHKPGIWIRKPGGDTIAELRARGYVITFGQKDHSWPGDNREGQVYIWWDSWLL